MDADTPHKHQYTDDERREALHLYVDLGRGEASRRCGIPSATIRSWAHRAGVAKKVPVSETDPRRNGSCPWSIRTGTSGSRYLSYGTGLPCSCLW